MLFMSCYVSYILRLHLTNVNNKFTYLLYLIKYKTASHSLLINSVYLFLRLPSVSDLTRSDTTTQDSFRTTTLTAPSLLDLFLAFVANRRSPLHGRGSSHDMDPIPISDETKIRSQDKDESHHKGPSGKIDFEELLKEFAGINSNKLPCKCPSVPEVPKKSEMDIIKEIIKEAGSEEAESKKKFNFRDSSDKDEGLGGLVIGGNSGSKGHDNKGGNHKNSEISDILEVISKENGKSNNGKISENHGKSSESHGKSSESHGKISDNNGKGSDNNGKSSENHGKSSESHGKSS